MAKFKKYDSSQRIFLPVSLEEQLMPGTLEFAIHTLIENRLDMTVFNENYKNDETGRSAYSPKILLKVILLGYSRGLISSRQLERASFGRSKTSGDYSRGSHFTVDVKGNNNQMNIVS